MKRFNFFSILLLLPLCIFGINVKIENARLVVDAKNNNGASVIEANCLLTVSGIKGKDFDVVAIVYDDNKDIHKDSNGNMVKTHYTLNAGYGDQFRKNVSVWIRHDKLSPKKGEHRYYVYLYVYYNGEWYGCTNAGSYTQKGGSTSSSSRSSGSSSSSKRTKSSQKKCDVCHGSKVCYNCNGSGKGSSFMLMGQMQTMPCFACNGNRVCPACNGTGLYVAPAGTGNGGYNSGNNSSSNNSSYNNTSGGVCPECGGLRYRRAVSYENDPSGAAFHLRELMQNPEGNKCPICGRYTYHCHMKCYKCN